VSALREPGCKACCAGDTCDAASAHRCVHTTACETRTPNTDGEASTDRCRLGTRGSTRHNPAGKYPTVGNTGTRCEPHTNLLANTT